MEALLEEKQQDYSEEELNALMRRYKETKDIELRNELVVHYSYIAKTVALQMYGMLSNYAQLEDIVNEGIIAIINCLEKFNPENGSSFKAYAFKRVQGAAIDFVRKQDWFPRRVRVNMRNIMTAHDQLCNELMREPTDQEMADRLGVSLSVYRKNNSEASNTLIYSFEEVIQNIFSSDSWLYSLVSMGDRPEQKLDKKELYETLKKAIESLSERERLVITLYYFEHLKLKSISKVMNVTDQRVSQIHSRAILKLKKYLDDCTKGDG